MTDQCFQSMPRACRNQGECHCLPSYVVAHTASPSIFFLSFQAPNEEQEKTIFVTLNHYAPILGVISSKLS